MKRIDSMMSSPPPDGRDPSPVRRLPATAPAGTQPASADVAFIELYHSRRDALVRLATLLVDESGEAEELVQEAFGEVYARWSAIDHPAAYLRTTVVNRCRDVQRRRLTARRSVGLVGTSAETVDHPDHLRDAIAALPPRQRTVVVLRYYEDLPVDEIASIMATRPGTVKSLLHRAMAQLREVIER